LPENLITPLLASIYTSPSIATLKDIDLHGTVYWDTEEAKLGLFELMKNANKLESFNNLKFSHFKGVDWRTRKSETELFHLFKVLSNISKHPEWKTLNEVNLSDSGSPEYGE